ncbi:uncharacterized protein BCR38DRAFT_468724 [Pseudomassariella vexata]|uniref:Microbial-type PARG catalytic domain-containing protein n=1 Tax=Pseudomassariella vexata TaxID=1141098 RepID=A0A1Y2DI86_9PEZI|nr:uncharacterized protein BCR38DRAFT_468724 [Pseudomassariella vexata]ORY58525.1 hypothetical protein BCR38DRAFT_468724 [Pseudomassariella vexata]
MGRVNPSRGLPPAAFRRDARAKRAKATINEDIPALLKSHARARKGVETAQLIPDPPMWRSSVPAAENASTNASKPPDDAVSDSGSHSSQTPNIAQQHQHPQVTLQMCDTLQAAHRLVSLNRGLRGKKSKVAVLNLASPLRPGGGFLTGATAQEESLCMRTTLYPSLRESFYRLPEVGCVYTSDVLVFRGWGDGYPDLPREERFFIDVVTAGMIRLPDVEGGGDAGDEKRYAEPKDREMAERKMRGVLRVLMMKGVRSVVLGAWGCGAYGNPVGEIARLWRKVLLGGTGGAGKKAGGSVKDECWGPMNVVFAISDASMARHFARAFGPELVVDDAVKEDEVDDEGDEGLGEIREKITELEIQVNQTRNLGLKTRLEAVLADLKRTIRVVWGRILTLTQPTYEDIG